MRRQFTYDVKLVVQHTVIGTLEFVTRSFQAAVEMGEHDYYFPFVVSNDSVKEEMQDALEEFAIANGYNINELQVITTEVSTNDEYIDISFSENESDNIYERNPAIEVEFIPQVFKPRTPTHFTGNHYDIGGIPAIGWIWEDVPGCAFRIYDEKDNIIAEVGINDTEYTETDVERGINYVRKIVAFNVDGESDPSQYKSVMVPVIEMDDSLISENRFGYIDITPIDEVKTDVETLPAFKSGIGDNHDLFTQASPYSAYESFDFDAIIEGYVTTKQKHFTEVQAKYRLILTGKQETDGPIQASATLSIVPWPMIKVSCQVNSTIYSKYTVNYTCDFNLNFWKKRPEFIGGNELPSIDVDEERPWFPELPGDGSGGGGGGGGGGSTPVNPGDIIWDQIGGSGSVDIGDNNITGGTAGDVILEGTLPNGDKVIIEVEVLPPTLGPADGSTDDKVEDGMDGNGGGVGGGIIKPDTEDDHVGDHGCPCLYVYKTCKFTIRLWLKNNKPVDNTLVEFKGYDNSIISIDKDGVVTGLELGLTHVYAHYKGGVTCFHIHVIDPKLVIIPENPAPIRVGESIHFQLRKANYIIPNDDIKWSCTNIATVDNDGVLVGEKVGVYTIYAEHRGERVFTTGQIIAPSIQWDFSTSQTTDDRYGMKLNRTILAMVVVNDKIIENDQLTFRMHNTSIATIDSTGNITGIKIGQTNLDATYKGYTITCIVEVVAAVITVTPKKEYSSTIDFGIKVGKTQQINVYDDGIIVDKNYLQFSTPSSSVFSVDSSGLVTAKSIGQSYVTVNYKGKNYRVTGIVLESVLELSTDKVSVYRGDSVEFDVLLDGEKLNYGVSFSGHDSSKISLTHSGVATGNEVGNGTFTASYGGLTASAEWEVLDREFGNGNPSYDTATYRITPVSFAISGSPVFKLQYLNYKDQWVDVTSGKLTWTVTSKKGELPSPASGAFRTEFLDTISGYNSDPKSWDYPYHETFVAKVVRTTAGYYDKSTFANVTISTPSISIASDAIFGEKDQNGVTKNVIMLHMYKPSDDTDPTVITSTQATAKYGSYIINRAKTRFTILDTGVARVDKDGRITPVSAGRTVLRVETLGVKSEIEVVVKNFYKAVRTTGDVTSNEIDVFESVSIRMERNGTVLGANSSTYETTSTTIINNGSGSFTGDYAGSFTVVVTCEGERRSYVGNVATPRVRIELVANKEPDAISPRTGNKWPDLYKVNVDTSVRYRVYVNDRLVNVNSKDFVFDVQAYGNVSNADNDYIYCTKPGIVRGYIKCRGGSSNLFEIEIGTIVVEATAVDELFPGNTMYMYTKDYRTDVRVPILSWSSYSTTYYNYQYIEEPISSDLCGRTTVLSGAGSTSGKIAQGGLRARMTVIYVPKSSQMYASVDDCYQDKTFASQDYRPRVYVSPDYYVRGFNNGAIYIDGIKVNNGDNIPMGCKVGGNYLGPEMRTYNDYKPGLGAGYGRKNDQCNYWYISTGNGLYPNDPNVIPNSLTDSSIVRASGWPKNTTTDARKRIEFTTSGRCGCKRDYATYPGRIVNFRGSVGSVATYYALTRRDYAVHTHWNSTSSNPRTCSHHTVDFAPLQNYEIVVDDPTIAAVSKSNSTVTIRWISPGATRVRLVPDDTIKDTHMTKEFYIHVYANSADTPLDVSDNYDIVFKGEQVPLKLRYDGRFTPNKETGYFVSGVNALDDNYNAIFQAIGPQSVSFGYRNVSASHTFHVLSSRAPAVTIYGSTSMYPGSTTTYNANIDGYSSIKNVPCKYMVTWSSSNSSVVTIDRYGRVLAKNAGTAIITARFLNTVETRTVTVTNYGTSTDSVRLIIQSGFYPAFEGESITFALRTYANTYPSGISYDKWLIGGVEYYGSNSMTKTFYDAMSSYSYAYCYYSYRCDATGQYHNHPNGWHPTSTYTTYTVSKRPEIPNLSMQRSGRSKKSLKADEANGFFFNSGGKEVYDIAPPEIDMKSFGKDYFHKSKTIRYDGSVDITTPIADKSVCDIIPTAQAIDDELSKVPTQGISVESVDFLSCDNANAILVHDKNDDTIKMSCDDRSKVFRALSTHKVELDVITKPKEVLVEAKDLVYKNHLGVTYTGNEDAHTIITYLGDVDLAVITDENGVVAPTSYTGDIPTITAALARPNTVSQTKQLDDVNRVDYFRYHELFDKAVDVYLIELAGLTTTGNLNIEYSDNIEKIVHNNKTYIKVRYDNEAYIKLTGIPTMIPLPYMAVSDELLATINGKEPMRKDGDGIEPYVTVTPSFGIAENRIFDYKIKLEILNTFGNNVNAWFDNETEKHTTMVDGDILTFTSDDFEMVDVFHRVICSSTKSSVFEITTHFEETINSPIYNPLHSAKWKDTDFVITRVSAVSRNPNVVVYPTVEDIDFKSSEYINQFKIPYEFRAFILSPSQGCWSPVIHPGYYFVNNNEYFLYKHNKPENGFGQEEVFATKKFYASIDAYTESVEGVHETNMAFDLSDGTLTGTILSNNTIIISPAEDMGIYESGEILFSEPLEEVEMKAYGELFNTSLEYSIYTNAEWSEFAPYLNAQSILTGSANIDGVKIRCTMTRAKDSSPVINKIVVNGQVVKWAIDDVVSKTILCDVPCDTKMHDVTDKTLLNIMTNELGVQGKSKKRISNIKVSIVDVHFDIEYNEDGSTPLRAKSTDIETITTDTSYIHFNENGFGEITPIPRLGRPVCVVKDGKSLKHITNYDSDGLLTHEHTDSKVFDGVPAMALTHHEFDQLKVMCGDREVAIKTVINNMVYFDPIVKITKGEVVTATYHVKNSFLIDYNYDIGENKSLLSVYLSEDDKDYSKIEVFYETASEGDYYARELEINPLYNPINSGFVYISDVPNLPSRITLNCTQTEFKLNDDEQTYVLINVLDKLGNQVPNVEVTATIANGNIEVLESKTNKLGVVAARYTPPKAYVGEDKLTVTCNGVTSEMVFRIREAQPPRFIVAKPKNGEYVVLNGSPTVITIDMYEDGLIPVTTETVRAMVENRPETTTTAVTNRNGHCELTIKPTVNSGYDICRIEITYKGIKEYLDLKVVI